MVNLNVFSLFILSFLIGQIAVADDLLQVTTQNNSTTATPENDWPNDFQINMPDLGATYYMDELQEWDFQSGFGGEKFYERLKYNPLIDDMIKIDRPVLLTFKENSDLLQSVATQFPDVKPATIAACILAENTMNVGVSDAAQNWLAANSKTAFNIGAVLFGKTKGSVSIGFGQINLDAARIGEPYVQKIESRDKPRTDDEIMESLLTIEGAFKYAGGIIQEAIDSYREVGIDIRSRPDLQCTLYNLGKTKERAQKAKASNKKPKPNYFGFFVNHYYDKIFDELGLKETVAAAAPTVDRPLSYKFRRAEVTGEIPMYQSIDTCDASISHLRSSSSNTKLLKGSYKEVGQDIDCDLMAWTFVQNSEGDYGWVPSYALQLVSRYTPIPEEEFIQNKTLSCHNGENKVAVDSCIQKIKETGIEIEKIDGGNIILSQTEDQIATLSNSFLNIRQSSLEAWEKVIADSKQKFLDFAASQSIPVTNWEDEINPYKGTFDFFSELKTCVNANPLCEIKSRFGSYYYYFTYLNSLENFTPEEVTKLSGYIKEMQVVKKDDYHNPQIAEPFILNEVQQEDLLKIVEIGKAEILQYYKNQGIDVPVWDHPNNKYKNLYRWAVDFEKCKSCGVYSGILQYSPNSFYMLLSNPVKYDPSLLRFIESTTVYSLDQYQLPEEIAGRPHLSDLARSLNQCRSFYNEDRYNYMPKYFSYAFNALANVHPDDINNSPFYFRLKTSIDKISEECRLHTECQKYKTSKEWEKCHMLNNDFDISFFCDLSGSRLNGSLKVALSDLMCIVGHDQACPFAGYNVPKLSKIAELPCVNQVTFTNLRGMEAILKSDYASEKLKEKAVYFNYNEVHYAGITLKGSCLKEQAIKNQTISAQ